MRNRTKKWTAWFFLIVLGIETFYPGMAYALTSGPVQPEMTKFEPAGVNDMVDLFTGDFKQNIPLVDVGGYPINLSYQSGGGMEDEASWVGFGWTVNPGTITRDLRGLPDDFNGDKVVKTYDRKEFKKIGGQVILKPSIFAWEIGDVKGGATFNLGIYKDNYYGVGASVGFSVSNRLAVNQKTTLTAGLDLNSDTRDGATFVPSLSLSRSHDWFEEENVRSLSGSLAYNTRAGLKQVDLGASFSTSQKKWSFLTFNFSGVKYFGQTYTPTFNTNTNNKGTTLSFDGGFTAFGTYIGVGGNGYYYEEKIDQKIVSTPAYGYMNYLNGRKLTNALIDYNREKDGVYVPGTPAIPVPVPTNDFFSATGQASSLQFRPYFNGNYVVFDKAYFNNSSNEKLGLTVGIGNLQKSGGRIDITSGSASTHKWVANNDFLVPGEPAFGSDPKEEAVNFKQTGEITQANDAYLTRIKNEKTVQVVINDKDHIFAVAKTLKNFKTREGMDLGELAPLKKDIRDKRTNVISFLNATQATQFALDKKIPGGERVNSTRKPHHLSEITVTDNAGKRMVYGIPVYNKKQLDVTFSIKDPVRNSAEEERALKTGLIAYSGSDNSTSNAQGRDNLFTQDEMPAYATSFLLTGILSPDYVDVKNDGISDDDLGTAYKFRYEKIESDFKWRAPYEFKTANYNQGFVSDRKDDKASYVYGEKELWYLDTVESKTMIAIFVKSDREDGLGVLDHNGGKSESVKLKKLDKIKLYSKADWIKNGVNAIPVKVVHFEYDYSTHPGVLNNTGRIVNKSGEVINENTQDKVNVNAAKGKLTLKRVYFTFGNNTRGQSNPYEFSYEQRKVSDVFGSLNFPPATNPEATNSYATRQADRWGTYKPGWYNRLTGNAATDGKLNNSEFPYAMQDNNNGSAAYDDRKLAALLASMWQLNKIVTPTGSTINVEYEADDYGYVQNRRAMQMCFVKSIGNNTGSITSGLINSDGFTVELPQAVGDIAEFKRNYLEGPDGESLKNIYYKIYTDLDNRDHKEYVQGYAEIDANACQYVSSTSVFIPLKKISNKYNPVSKAAWQMLKTDLPQYAYDNYDNSDVPFTAATLKSLVQSFVNMREYFQSYEKTASNRKFANNIELTKSMVRLYNPDQKKMGGGARVKKLTIEDAWHEMSHDAGKTARYGQVYDYSIKKANGQKISSGVAAYEPQIGNEENPFHEPIPYTEKVHWAPDKYHFVERPFCESFFPAASVGYSKVTVTNFGDSEVNLPEPAKHTGYIESEFYTARDFPTLVDNMPLESTEYENGLIVKLFTSTTIKRVATSQGFKIELNDMHGKPKSVKVFDKGGNEISSTETFYNVDDDGAEVKHLNNYVDIVKGVDGGKIETVLMGEDVDLATDVRESKNESMGGSLGIYNGSLIIPWFPVPIYIPYFSANPGYSITRDSYNSISTVKVIHKYGIVKKVRTVKNGSSIVAENMLWDGETGAVLLTKTQNEFNDHSFAFTYPAYWAEGHEGMGAAYQNIGAVLPNLNTQSAGVIPDSYKTILFPGDELISGNQKFWVMKSGDGFLRLIDAGGNMVSAIGNYTVYRSGKRNLTGASAGSIVCMNNPVVGSGANRSLQFNVGNKILNAAAVLYSNEWGVPVPNRLGAVPYESGAFGSNIFTISSNNTTGPDCYKNFEATYTWVSGSVVKIGYMNFPGFYPNPIPANATILSAQLTLTPVSALMSGQNDSRLMRVMEEVNCATNNHANDRPMTTGINLVEIPQITSQETETRTFDVTAMFKDWFTRRDAPVFGVSIIRKYAVLGSMSFFGTNGKIPPSLSVTYTVPGCVDPVDRPLNPYVNGILGNWRPKQNFVYMVDREQKAGLAALPGSTNIRTSGAYTSFNPFWEFKPLGGIYSNVQVEPSLAAERWVWASKSIYYDQKGNEVESAAPINRDRQGNIDVSGNAYRYNAALYGYRESAAIAVANNARHNEIAFDGFEDYYFTLQEGFNETCPSKRHFDWGLTNQANGWCASGSCLSSEETHSGKYSLKLGGAIGVSKSEGRAAPPASILSYNATNGQAILMANELANGFAPVAGKKYLLSMWVNDGQPTVNTVSGLTVQINYQPADLSKPVPVVEGWKQLVIPFMAGSQFQLQLQGSSIYIDDVRIFPYDANITSFVYDDRTMRLMAQLDENNFATFYEYDDEGTPVRVKKETERGVMTLKENRQSFRNRP
jgi:hypothetical protein